MFIRNLKVGKRILSSGRNLRKDGTAQVVIEIIEFNFDGKQKIKRKPTTVFIKPEDWDIKNKVVKLSDPDSNNKNNIIDQHYEDTLVEVQGMEKAATTMRNFIKYPTIYEKTITNYFDDYIDYRKKTGTPRGTYKEFITCKNRIKAFEDFRKTKFKFIDLNLSWSDYFYIFLLSKYKTGTIGKTYTILKTVLLYFYDRREELKLQMTDKFKSKSWKHGEMSENNPEPISVVQLKLMAAYDFADDLRLQQMRDRFLFQCSMGARYSDAFLISQKNIKKEMIEYFPLKTIHKKDNKVQVPLNNLSKSILAKYGWDMTNLKISNQKYNLGLADMFNALIKKYPEDFDIIHTSHHGRDTFISNCINEGIDVPTLLKMVGQTNYNQMRKYFKLSSEHSIEKMKSVTLYDISI